MPVYEFSCQECGKRVEVRGNITENISAPSCDLCNIVMVRKYKISGIQFKGSGFYVTDE